MAYEHEKSLKNRLLNLELDDYVEVIQLEKEYEELEEVYAKAKAFDEISQVFKKVTIYNTATALEVKEILDKLEDK